MLSKLTFFSKISFMITIKLRNSLDPDQGRCFAMLDLGPNSLSSRGYPRGFGVDNGGLLALKAPITTAADDDFCDIFSNFPKKNKI